MIRWLFRNKSMSVSEAGRLGAAAANTKRKERILEKARQLRAECGLGEDPRLA